MITGQWRWPHHRQHQEHRAHTAPPRMPRQPSADEQYTHRDQGEQHRPGPAARPVHSRAGQRGPGTGDPRDPLGRPTSAPGQPFGHRHRHRCRRQRREPQHRGRRDRELHEQIAGHPHQAHPRRQHGDDRRAQGLGRARGGQRLGEPRRNPAPAQRRAPARGQREQRPGGQHGEQEAVTAGQFRVVQHQEEHGRRQRREQGICGVRWPGRAGATAPQAAARSTLGSGRHTTTKAVPAPRRAARSSAGRYRDGAPAPALAAWASPGGPSSRASTIVKLAPDTASVCARSVSLNASSSSGVIRDVSPTTRPGSSARASAGSPSVASRSPARSRPASRCAPDGPATTSGASRPPRTRSTAAIRSPLVLGGADRAVTRSRVVGSRSQPARGAGPGTGEPRVVRAPAEARPSAPHSRPCPRGRPRPCRRRRRHSRPRPRAAAPASVSPPLSRPLPSPVVRRLRSARWAARPGFPGRGAG